MIFHFTIYRVPTALKHRCLYYKVTGLTMAMALSEGEILDQHFPELCKLLNIGTIKSYLKAAQSLTEGESKQIETGAKIKKDEAVRRLVAILKRKGPRCASLLVSALQQSVNSRGKPRGHLQLITNLEQALRKSGILCRIQNGKYAVFHLVACTFRADLQSQTSKYGMLLCICDLNIKFLAMYCFLTSTCTYYYTEADLLSTKQFWSINDTVGHYLPPYSVRKR